MSFTFRIKSIYCDRVRSTFCLSVGSWSLTTKVSSNHLNKKHCFLKYLSVYPSHSINRIPSYTSISIQSQSHSVNYVAHGTYNHMKIIHYFRPFKLIISKQDLTSKSFLILLLRCLQFRSFSIKIVKTHH